MNSVEFESFLDKHNNHKQGTKLRSNNLWFAALTLPQVVSATFGPCCGRYAKVVILLIQL